MHLTKECDYALRAVIYLASTEPRVCSASEISKAQNVSPKFLARIMPKLVKTGIILSLPGSKGGYQLSRPSRELTFLQVLEAIESPVYINVCLNERFINCGRKDKCGMKHIWEHLHKKMVELFSQITFDQLTEKIPPQ